MKGKALERMVVNSKAAATVNELGTLAKGKTFLDKFEQYLLCDELRLDVR